MACAPSEDSDQPGHPPCLIRVFAVRMKKALVLSYPLSAQRRLWSDWADAEADLSLRWGHSHFVGFVMRRLIYFLLSLSCKMSAYMHLPNLLLMHRWATVVRKHISKTFSLQTCSNPTWSVHAFGQQKCIGIENIWWSTILHVLTGTTCVRRSKSCYWLKSN